jgi:hypothetical protein
MARSVTLGWLAILATACSEGAPEPWNAAEMRALSEQFGFNSFILFSPIPL